MFDKNEAEIAFNSISIFVNLDYC